MADLECTSNGVKYYWYLTGPDGAHFVLYKEQHTKDEIQVAKRELYRDRDVVSMRISKEMPT